MHHRGEGGEVVHGLSPRCCARRMPASREPTVVSTVKASQNRKLRSAGYAGGLHIRLLGPVAVANAGATVAIASKKSRALLGYLTLRAGVEIPRGVLTGLLWGERSESQARASLR